jgi:hypothetical protein
MEPFGDGPRKCLFLWDDQCPLNDHLRSEEIGIRLLGQALWGWRTAPCFAARGCGLASQSITPVRPELIIIIHLLGLAPAGCLAAPDNGAERRYTGGVQPNTLNGRRMSGRAIERG